MSKTAILKAFLVPPLLALSLLGCNTGTITDDDGTEAPPHTQGGNSSDPSNPNGSGTDPGVDPAPDPTVARTSVEPTESSEELLNPERGYYVGYNLVGGGSAASLRAGGHTLAIALVRLDDYRTTDIDAAFLSRLTAGFAQVRAAGIKVVLRFTYNSSYADDASRTQILRHIEQLTPILAENVDVIAVLQAGFIGAWGEWHSSTNGLENDADRTAILNALLAAMPPQRGVQVRTPMYKEAAFPGGALAAGEAYSGTSRARVGHHNDCFLASSSDYGTYASPVDYWEDYTATDGQFTAIGGETCHVYEAKTNCEAAVATMAGLHWSYLNEEYNKDVLAVWNASGCAQTVIDRLGYRFAATRITHDDVVARGGTLHVDLEIANRGFAAPFNARPVEVVITNGTTRVVERLDVDARRFAPGVTTTFSAAIAVPASLPPGTYSIAVRMPDADDRLADDARYAIRLANTDVWDEATGDNVLVRTLRVE